MARLRPVPASHHASSATFVHKDLHNCTHVFLRQDATRRALEPPYSGPYQVLSQLLVRGKAVTVSADRVKPAYVLNEADCGSTIFNPLATATRHSTISSYTDYTLRSPCSLPSTLQYLSNILRGGWCGNLPQSSFTPNCQSPRVLASSQSTWSITAPSCIGSRPASRQRRTFRSAKSVIQLPVWRRVRILPP
jgi:hypothetical protein